MKKNRVIPMLCDYCKRKIEEGEEYFDMPDAMVCEDCISDYIRDHRVEYLEPTSEKMESWDEWNGEK